MTKGDNMFIGRQKELKTLYEAFTSDRQDNILIYGRRRIGKTELIKEAVKDHKGIYFEASEDIAVNDIERLSNVIGEYYGLPISFKNIREAIEFMFKRGIEEELYFVIDEYPYLKKTISGIDSIIQNIIDEYKDRSKLKFILCGSYVDVMRGLMIRSIADSYEMPEK